MPFAKIEALGTVKNYTRTDEGVKVGLKDVLFPDKVRDTLDFWIDSEVQVRVTIATYQDELPMKDTGTDAAPTDGQ